MIAFAGRAACSCADNDIKALWKILFVFPVCLTYDTPCTAPCHSVSDFLTCGYAYPVLVCAVAAVIDCTQSARDKGALAVKPHKILIIIQLYCVEHMLSLSRLKNMTANLWFAVITLLTGALSEPSVLLPDPAASALVCEHFSALCSSACEYLAAVLCGHSLHKAVLFFSVELLRLICSFHCFSPPLSILFKNHCLYFS